MAGKQFPRLPILASVVTLSLVICSHLSIRTQAQVPPISLSRSIPDSWNFEPPYRGSPDNREGGATRRPTDPKDLQRRIDPIGCIHEQNKTLTPLGPSSFDNIPPRVTSTLAAYPTFYWYSPTTSARSVQFVLLDGKREVYSTTFAIAGKPGIVSLKLPSSATLPPLEVDKEYTWELTLMCDQDDSQNNPSVQGLIKRVEANPVLTDKINNATPEELITLYANAHLWHETLATLAELRRSRPNDPVLTAAWEKLLNSAGLNMVAQEPFFTF